MPLIDEAKRIWMGAVKPLNGAAAVRRHVHLESSRWCLHGWECDLRSVRDVIVVGAGKASVGMACGLLEVLEPIRDEHAIRGWIQVVEGQERSLERWEGKGVTFFPARPVGSNEPTERVLEGTRQIQKRVLEAGVDDLVIGLWSGGGSALLAAPRKGIRLEDKVGLGRWFAERGATIEEWNRVRRVLSDVKGGRLLRGCRAKRVVSLVLSDVLGESLELVASGPMWTSARSQFEEAKRTLEKWTNQGHALPPFLEACWEEIQAEAKTEDSDGYRGEVIHRSVGNNEEAIGLALEAACGLGWEVERLANPQYESVATVATRIVETAKQGAGESQPRCWVWGGEASLEIAPKGKCGLGGRNQHLALEVLAQAILQPPIAGRWLFLAGGTDGEDGTTSVAGAWVDSEWVDAMRSERATIEAFRASFDSHTFFRQLQRLWEPGATGTNVCDLAILLVVPPGCDDGSKPIRG